MLAAQDEQQRVVRPLRPLEIPGLAVRGAEEPLHLDVRDVDAGGQAQLIERSRDVAGGVGDAREHQVQRGALGRPPPAELGEHPLGELARLREAPRDAEGLGELSADVPIVGVDRARALQHLDRPLWRGQALHVRPGSLRQQLEARCFVRDQLGAFLEDGDQRLPVAGLAIEPHQELTHLQVRGILLEPVTELAHRALGLRGGDLGGRQPQDGVGAVPRPRHGEALLEPLDRRGVLAALRVDPR